MDNNQTLLLAKLMAGIAWADNDFHPLEKKSIEYLLNNREDLGYQDRQSVHLYFEYPVSKPELNAIINKMKQYFYDDESIHTAIIWIKKLIRADGKVELKEREIYDLVLSSLKDKSKTPSRNSWTRFLTNKLPLKETDLPSGDPNFISREKHLDDFINNPLYYKVYQSMSHGEDEFGRVDFDKDQLRKICFAVTLMVVIILADEDVCKEELEKSVLFLSAWLSVPEDLSNVIINKALELNYSAISVSRICRNFSSQTSLTERKHFLEILMEIAGSDGDFPECERSKIWLIAKNFQLHESTLNKLKIVLKEMNTEVESDLS